MKKVIFFFSLAFLVIAGVMFYLVRVGVSLRPANYIKPSAMTEGMQTVARDVGLRLFPDLQGVDYVVWGVSATDSEAQEVFQLLKAEEEISKGKPITVLTGPLTAEQVSQCKAPCWIVQEQERAHELQANTFTSETFAPLAKSFKKRYFTMTVVPFQFGKTVPDECWAERRLDFQCVQLVSVQTIERKMPKAARGQPQSQRGRYFFLNKYNESDFFLFLESPL